jgi:hypothetical protein
MSGNPRTAVLGVWTSATGSLIAALIVCPAGQTLILKSLLVYNGAGVTANPAVWVDTGPGQPTVHIVQAAVATNTTEQWNGWVALEPGHRLVANTDQPNTTVWASGTVLMGTATLP